MFDNNRILIQKNYNYFFGAKIKNRVLPTKKRNLDNPFITTKKYINILKRNRKKLYGLDIDPNKCVYLTLTTAYSMG